MNHFSKLFLSAVLSSFFAVGANAQGVQSGTGLLCGTADEAKSFVKLHPDDLQSAIAAFESESGSKSPCLVAKVAYVPGKEMGRIDQKDATYVVTEIVIVGVATPYGMLKIKDCPLRR